MLIKEASWITMPGADSLTVPVFRRTFACRGPVRAAELEVTCDGVYEIDIPVEGEVILNGKRFTLPEGRYLFGQG